MEPYLQHYKALLEHPKFIDGNWNLVAGDRPGTTVQVHF